MPLISMFPCSAGGASIDYNSRPQIDFDGKWVQWFIEFYDGQPYWEAWFLSSGTMTVDGTYTADLWAIGGGAVDSDGINKRGSAALALDVQLSGTLAVTIGAGASNYNDKVGGDTSLSGKITARGGDNDVVSDGKPYRFFAEEKASEAGENATGNEKNTRGYGAGGWMNWASNKKLEGEGYGAGGGVAMTSSTYVYRNAHFGALTVRIKA